MSIDRIENVTNTVNLTKVQTVVKKQEKPDQETRCSDVVSIGKSEAISATQVKWPPLLPIGDTQGIYEIDEQ
ncbi:hypothetical protein [Syntrophorhabdus aromaticivorans]|uniref:Uncharacterized protein n=1 Tax=Syntrophorhabdus aromaticivorans TaxID=328301 RepID=A0A971S1L7_9BACT|nr:hypothetical protein [Syntrophorhabdus aromaticivorans]NLW35659.1 hypothetical protein [Syntrophorhabdus aromaticivorans]